NTFSSGLMVTVKPDVEPARYFLGIEVGVTDLGTGPFLASEYGSIDTVYSPGTAPSGSLFVYVRIRKVPSSWVSPSASVPLVRCFGSKWIVARRTGSPFASRTLPRVG